MEKITVVVNLEYKPGDKPGQFLKTNVEIPKNLKGSEKDFAVECAVYERLRLTIEEGD